MRKVIVAALIVAVVLFFAYLIGAFIALDFNITNWGEKVRILVAITGCSMAIACALGALLARFCQKSYDKAHG